MSPRKQRLGAYKHINHDTGETLSERGNVLTSTRGTQREIVFVIFPFIFIQANDVKDPVCVP